MNLEPVLAPIRAFANSGIGLNHFVALAMLLFLIGLYGVMTRRNIVAILMSVEIMLNAAMLVFVSAAAYSGDSTATGGVFALFIVAIAAAEVAVGLAIFINVFRSKGGVTTEDLMEMNY
ncbi:MAG: NADH-quinone oxidoreductase subunit NuoK [Deinococcales bacterium]